MSKAGQPLGRADFLSLLEPQKGASSNRERSIEGTRSRKDPKDEFRRNGLINIIGDSVNKHGLQSDKRPPIRHFSAGQISTNSTVPDLSLHDSELQKSSRVSESVASPEGSQQDSFNPKSLNYLVDKLLSLGDRPEGNGGRTRAFGPSMRPRPRFEKVERVSASGGRPKEDPELKAPIPILDLLIKDEYDSRVRPMIKSLNEQRSLSYTKPARSTAIGPAAAAATTKSVPTNHRPQQDEGAQFDAENGSEMSVSREQTMNELAATTSIPNSKQATDSILVSSTEKSNVTLDENDSAATLADDEYEEDEETPSTVAEREKPRHTMTTTTSKPLGQKKILHNVPPYQLNSFASIQSNSFPDHSLESKRVTTGELAGGPLDSLSTASNVGSSETRLDIGKPVETTPMVFSDGEHEPANKRRNEGSLSSSGPPNEQQISNRQDATRQTTGSTKSDKFGDSFLLNHLLTTSNPLSLNGGDLGNINNNNNNNYNNMISGHRKAFSPLASNGHESQLKREQNPLIYKGYVGKDDYLISTTASDWSRHIGQDRANFGGHQTTSVMNKMVPMTSSTTMAPPTEPPTVPYNYYLNQPVTNAQSVPEMIVPTLSPPEGFNTRTTPTTAPPSRVQQSRFRPSNQLHQNDSQLFGWPVAGLRPPQAAENTNRSAPEKFFNVIINDRNYSYQLAPDTPNTRTTVAEDKDEPQLKGHPVGRFVVPTSESEPMEQWKKVATSSMANGTAAGGGGVWLPSSEGGSSSNGTRMGQSNSATSGHKKAGPVNATNANPLRNSPMVEVVSSKSSRKQIIASNNGQQSDNNRSLEEAPKSRETAAGGATRLPPGQLSNFATRTTTLKRNKSDSKLADRFSQGSSPNATTATTSLLPNEEETEESEPGDDEPSLGSDSATQEKAGAKQRVSGDEDRSAVENEPNSSVEDPTSTSGEEAPKEETGAALGEAAIQGERVFTQSKNQPGKQLKTNSNANSGAPKSRSRPKNGSSAAPSASWANGEGFVFMKNSSLPTGTKHTTRLKEHQNQNGSRTASESKVFNSTTKLVQLYHQPARQPETILIGANELADGLEPAQAAPPNENNLYLGGLNQGSTGFPAGSFFGEAASSERPTMETPIRVLHDMHVGVRLPNGSGGNKNEHQLAGMNPQLVLDPYQRTSSNTILSTVLQPTSSTSSTTNSPLPSQTQTAGPKSVTSGGGGNLLTIPLRELSQPNQPSPNEPPPISQSGNNTGSKMAPKPSNDRLAFILIGGSCVLSVVCLVLAALSIRCQDVCDDYQSLRNAERAALKLQKHRLKYMKSHQVSQFKQAASGNHQLRSAESRQSLIDDLQSVDNFAARLPLDQELGGQGRNNVAPNGNAASNGLSRVIQSKQMGNNNNNNNNNQSENNSKNNGTECRLPLAAFMGPGQVCGCENCASRRLIMHQDLMTVGASKHLSWFHPYFHPQGHHSRLKPLFGAGSSVGTFLPKQRDLDPGQRPASPMDGHLLFEGGLCAASHPVARSKSILSRHHQQHGSSAASHKQPNLVAFESAGVGTCGHHAGGHEYNQHANSHHHHHHHHPLCQTAHRQSSAGPNLKCSHHHQTNESLTASDSSELTLDDRQLICNNEHHCNADHHHQQQAAQQSMANNRQRLLQMGKLNGSQFQAGWKKQLSEQAREATLNEAPNGDTFQLEHQRANNNARFNNNHQHQHQHQHHKHNHHHQHQHQHQTTSDDSSSIAQCTCAREQKPLIGSAAAAAGRDPSQNGTDYKRLLLARNIKAAVKQQAKRDKSMLVWSTNGDRLI